MARHARSRPDPSGGTPPPTRRRRRTAIGVALATFVAAAAVSAVPGAAFASAGTATITSGGPLTSIGTSTDLNCSVNHTGDTSGEWFGDTACGTLLATGGTLYGPASIPAGGGASPRTAWTEVSQTAVTGAGTAANPYKVVTVATAGSAGVKVTQTDTYVVGQESYRNDVVVQNTGTAAASGILYRAGDCYLQDSDSGYGIVNAASGAVTCTTDLAPGSRIQQMLPLTAGSSYYESNYSQVWAKIGSQQPFDNSCLCTQLIDNGLGLSWSFAVAAGASKTYSSLVTFSPLGALPLTMTKVADQASVVAGGNDGYTITVTNPNPAAVTLTTLQDVLPAGFSYRAGTTTGATTTDPAVSGQTLTWSSISVPGGGTASVRFGVKVSMTPGTYTDEASATATNFTVVPTGPTAPVTVTAAANTPPVANNGTVTTPKNTAANGTATASDANGDALTFSVVAQPAHGTVIMAAGGGFTYTPAADYVGADSFTFKANDGQADSNTATISVTVTSPSAAATTTNLSASPVGPVVVGTSVTFSAVIGPPGSIPGSVQFKDGATNLGGPVAVSAGQASVTTSALAAGSHTISAVFTPTDTAAWLGSSDSLSFTVTTPSATATTTTVASVPASPVVSGTSVTFTATVSPSAAGTVQFKDGSTAIGGPVTVAGGKASVTTSALAVGGHTINAVFTPADASAFTGSSGSLSFTVNPVSDTTTVTLTGGKTAVGIYTPVANALAAAGITVSPIYPGYAVASTTRGHLTRASFLIDRGSTVELRNGEVVGGTITHKGGLQFAANGHTVGVADFRIDVAAGTITATRVKVDGGAWTATDLPLFTISFLHGTKPFTRASGSRIYAILPGIQTTLTSQAADALNGALGLGDGFTFQGGLVVGEGTVYGRLN